MSDDTELMDRKEDPLYWERKRQRERRVQSVLLSFIVGLALWIVTEVGSLVGITSAIKEHVASHDVQIGAAYQAKDAKRDMADIQGRLASTDVINAQQQTLIEQNQKRIEKLEETEEFRRGVIQGQQNARQKAQGH